jgi:Ni/Co efflux regulator RcnB
MKKYLIVLVGSLAFAAANAMAAPAPQPQPAGQSWHAQNGQRDHGDRRDDHDRRGDWRGEDNRSRSRHDSRGRPNNHGRYDDRGRYYSMHDRGRHEGWYKRGGHMPVEYRTTRYYVDDYRVYHLRQPQRGYRWVRSDNGDFLMVAIATGIIASIIAGN